MYFEFMPPYFWMERLDRQMRDIVVLNSGGLDSAATMAWAIENFRSVHSVAIDYDQRNIIELQAAKEVAKYFMATSHSVVALKGLADPAQCMFMNDVVPHTARVGDKMTNSYVPARNAMFVLMAAREAYKRELRDIAVGITQTVTRVKDQSGKFAKRMEQLLEAGMDGENWKLHTPVLNFSRADELKYLHDRGFFPVVGMTWTCYETGPSPCRKCLACQGRAKGFAELGLLDPALVRTW